MKVTLKDIAEQANVSISTVSRVLNNSSTSLDEEIKLKIFQIAEKIGYTNSKKVEKKTEIFPEMKIGCVINNLKDKYSDPYFSEIIYGIEREIIDQGLSLTFFYDSSELMGKISNEKLLQFNNLGLICIGSMFRSLMLELPGKIPYILSLGDTPRFPGELGIDHLTIDFIHSAFSAVNHLIEGGHRDIAFIGANSATGTNLKDEQRFLGFQSAMKQGNLTIRSEWIEDGKFHLSGGYEAMKRILSGKHKPTALFAASDRMAMGAYKAIQEFGLTIPNDIAVVSFDNIQMSEFISPTLTTVHVPREELGRTAVKLLIQRMQGNIPLPMTTYLPTSLIIRDSCGCIKKTAEEVYRMK